MLGLAFSVGASGTLLSQENAVAADPSAKSLLLAAALPQAGSSGNGAVSQSAVYHTVQPGDSLWQIAQAHRVDIQAIKAANGISPDEVIKVGQVLRVPAGSSARVSRDLTAPAPQPASNWVASAAPSTSTPQPVAAAAEPETLAAQISDVEPAKADWVESNALQSLALANQAQGSGALTEAEALQAAASTPQSGIAAPSAASQPLESDADAAWVTRTFESVQAASPANAPEATSEVATLPEAAQVAPSEIDKKPQQIAALSERLGGAAAAQPTVPVVPATETYRVKPGDTLWTIASRYGLRPEALAAANAVRDPNLIVAGDVIEIPSHSAAAATSSIGSVPTGSVAERIARIREAGESSVNRAELYERIRLARQSLDQRQASEVKSQVEAAPTAASDAVEVASDNAEPEVAADLPLSLPLNSTPAAGQRDPHVANLIADIRAMQRQRTVAIADDQLSSASATPAAAESADQAPQLAVAPSSVIRRVSPQATEAEPTNPEFAPAAAEPAAPGPELLAAAPLGPEAYAPVMGTPTGRVVSPDMPILPDAGEYLPEAPNRFNGYMWPAQGILTSGYGWRWGRMHRGVDIAGPVGTPIYAAAAGTVVRSGWNSGGYGNLVDIRHPDGSMTRYAHNSRLLVRAGQEVRQGQQIAEMGSTGFSTGPHLHFEVHLPGTGTVNPIAHLPRR
jgi:murein DD-endopeptidase MepM/ murein hydrolase activator NlpD